MYVPDILSSKHNLKKSLYPYYDILCGVVREIKINKSGKTIDKEQYDRLINICMFELSNKLQAIMLFNTLLIEYLLKYENEINPETIINQQNILAVLDAYLNSLHSIRDFMNQVDKIVGYKNTDLYIHPLGIFAVLFDLRNIFHHNQSPFIHIENKWINLRFNILPRNPVKIQIFPQDASGFYSLKINCYELTMHFFSDFNKWAKSYVDLLPGDTILYIFTSRNVNGKWDNITKSIDELKEIVETKDF